MADYETMVALLKNVSKTPLTATNATNSYLQSSFYFLFLIKEQYCEFVVLRGQSL